MAQVKSSEADCTSAPPESGETADKNFHFLGAEMYVILNDEEQKVISERNAAIREKLSIRAKSKKGKTQNTSMGDAFIKVDNDLDGQGSDSCADTNERRLRTVLKIKKLHPSALGFKIPFLVLLDIELANLLEFLTPCADERAAKGQVLIQLEMVVLSLFPNAKVIPFGSYVTGLSLPGADVDVAIKADGADSLVLKMLVYALNRLDLLHSFECIFDTNVPLVKILDKQTGVKLDVSMFTECCATTTDFIKDKCRKYKYMPPLILLIKLFLQIRNLGDSYFGGVGSYLLYCMVLSFLQMHDSSFFSNANEENTLASLFVDFFYYWGYLRDYERFVTCVRGFGHVYPRRLFHGDAHGVFACENPVDVSVDIGRNVRNMRSIRTAFQNAYLALASIDKDITEYTHKRRYPLSGRDTILENLYDPLHPIFQHRNKNTASHTNWTLYKFRNKDNAIDSLNTACQMLQGCLSKQTGGNDSADGDTNTDTEEQPPYPPHTKVLGHNHLPFYIEAEKSAQKCWCN